MLESSATLFQFEANDQVAAVLLRSAQSLSDWQQPDRPEDLAFLTAEGETVFLSTAHEEQAYFSLTDWQHTGLLAKAPALRDRIALSALRDLEFDDAVAPGPYSPETPDDDC